jgi:predicted nucleic acid-binding Zn ribbon protein
LFQSITEPVKKKCPECKKPKLRRLFGTGAAVMFKGSGFYTTDYRSESYKKRASEEKPSSSNGAPESKPDGAAKSDGKSKANAEAKTEKKASKKSNDQ